MVSLMPLNPLPTEPLNIVIVTTSIYHWEKSYCGKIVSHVTVANWALRIGSKACNPAPVGMENIPLFIGCDR